MLTIRNLNVTGERKRPAALVCVIYIYTVHMRALCLFSFGMFDVGSCMCFAYTEWLSYQKSYRIHASYV